MYPKASSSSTRPCTRISSCTSGLRISGHWSMMLLDQLISWQADLEVRQHIEERNLFARCFELVSDQMQVNIVKISGPPANARGCCQNSEGGGAVEVLLGTVCRCLCRVLRLTCNASSGFVDVTMYSKHAFNPCWHRQTESLPSIFVHAGPGTTASRLSAICSLLATKAPLTSS